MSGNESCRIEEIDSLDSRFTRDEEVSMRNPLLPSTTMSYSGDELGHEERSSQEIIRPCYYILQILGMWKPNNGNLDFIWRLYREVVWVFWLGCLAAIMCLDFVHWGFTTKSIHIREVLNSACTCLDFLCPYLFTLYYIKRGQFVALVSSVQNVSEAWKMKLSRVAKWYTFCSVCLWVLCATFVMAHWFPFFFKPWHYALYTAVIIYMSGWWAVWLNIYGFACHVHSLQIDTLVEEIKRSDCRAATVLYKHFRLQTSLQRTQKDFNFIISFALAYHAVDLIVFSFAYFNSAFGSDYPIWQYIGTLMFDLISIIFKLYPPAIVADAVHRIAAQASGRCQLYVTPLTTDLPIEDIQLFQYIALCEPDMGLKILGIRITVELSLKILMTIVTATISFVIFVIPRL